MTKYFVDRAGNYIGAFDGAEPPASSIEVPSAPSDARQPWLGDHWGEIQKTAEQLRAEWKAERADLVASIKVTTKLGHTFDGDEESQGRMARAILGLQVVPGGSVTWVLADNSVLEVGAAELSEALALAGAEQARLWIEGAPHD